MKVSGTLAAISVGSELSCLSWRSISLHYSIEYLILFLLLLSQLFVLLLFLSLSIGFSIFVESFMGRLSAAYY